ncbi:MAG: hypothetical protein ACJA08_001234 [Cyclobacteriaceae bacterium]|jgi:hypothetical protein
MFKKIFLPFLVLNGFWAGAQIKPIDSIQFIKHINYLERKLNYDYYSDDQKLWWINKFSYDEDENRITVKNISTGSLGKVTGKNYILNSVCLSDLNPFNIEYSKTSKTQGRFVKGQKISLHTVSGKSLVKKEINSRSSSRTSFIYLALPDFLNNDSHVSDSVYKAFKEIINYATTIYNQGDNLENFETIFDSMLGNHQYTDQNGLVNRYGEKHNDYLISFEDYQDREKLRDVFFGYDPVKTKYYEMIIGVDGQQLTRYYTLSDDEKLLLLSEENDIKIWFANKSKIIYQLEDQMLELTYFNP